MECPTPELIVVDSEYEYASKKFKNYGKYLKIRICDYVVIMNYLLEYGIKDELISNNIRSIIDEMKKYPDLIDNLCSEIGELCTQYRNDIDEADDFLY